MNPKNTPILPLLLMVSASSPARAELDVRISTRSASTFQSVKVSAAVPATGSQDQAPVVSLTVAGPDDRRHSYRLFPAAAGRWEGRFTPTRPGRYTGTVVVARGEDHEIGLVPALDVRAGTRRGFVRSLNRGGRTFECATGGLFPMGIDLTLASSPDTAPRDLCALLARHSANYVRLTLPWEPGLVEAMESSADTSAFKSLRSVDSWLAGAEEKGLFIQLRVEGAGSGDGEYQNFVQLAAARWGPYPSLAAWEVDTGAPGAGALAVRDWIAGLRKSDPGSHLVTAAGLPEAPAKELGCDFQTRQTGAAGPRDLSGGITILAGQTGSPSWFAGLVQDGIGLPLAPFDPAADLDLLLAALPAAASVARSIPWHSPGRARATLHGGESGGWQSYGQAVLAALGAPGLGEQRQTVTLEVRGAAARSVAHLYSAAGEKIGERAIAAPGGSARVELHGGEARAAFCCVLPAPAASAVGLRRSPVRRGR